MINLVNLKPFVVGLTSTVALAWGTPTLAQSVSLQSATLGAIRQFFGLPVTSVQSIGWRFNVTSPLQVTQVGGHLVGDGGGRPIAVTIVRLSSPTAFPTASPPAPSEVVASTTFIPPSVLTVRSQDVRIPLPALLAPGNYALMFGSFPGGGVGRLTINNPTLPGSTYFLSGAGTYQNIDPATQLTNLRFVVEGN
jgi:hypothetical protein